MLSAHPRIRLVTYLLALVLGAAGYFASALISGELGEAFQNASAFLMAAALGVAASNTPEVSRGD